MTSHMPVIRIFLKLIFSCLDFLKSNCHLVHQTKKSLQKLPLDSIYIKIMELRKDLCIVQKILEIIFLPQYLFSIIIIPEKLI